MADATEPPWHPRHRVPVAMLAGCLFAAVAVLRGFSHAGEGTTLLFCLPIGLLALTFGRIGGAAAGAVGFGLFAAFATGDLGGGRLGLAEWLTRGIVLLVVALLVGDVAQRLRASERRALAERERRLDLEARMAREQAAVEVYDTLIQGMTAAKWLAEQEHHERVVELLEATIAKGVRLVSQLLRHTEAWGRATVTSAELPDQG